MQLASRSPSLKSKNPQLQGARLSPLSPSFDHGRQQVHFCSSACMSWLRLRLCVIALTVGPWMFPEGEVRGAEVVGGVWKQPATFVPPEIGSIHSG
eukprot:1832728-Rhodomonas_salina.1